MITITNYSAHILVDNAGSKKVLIKPFTVKDSYQGTHISLVDTYNVESFINLSMLTGFVYADNADLINQLMLISANTDFVSTVNTYADLPAPATVNNRFFYVKIASGTRWLPGNYGGLYYPNGTYYSDGTNWITGVDLFQSVQRITGTVTVANPTSNPETGLAKDSTLSGLSTKIPSGLVVTTGRLQVELPSGGTGLTNTEIRATALPVSASSLPLPTGASTESTLAALSTKIPSGLVVTTGRLQVELPAGGTGLTNTEIRATPLPVSGTVAVSNMIAAVETGLSKDVTLGSLSEVAPISDTASSGLNGRLQRVAQRITSLITALGTPFQAGGSIGNTSFVSNAGTNLNTSALSLESTQALIKAKTDNIPALGQALAASSTPIVLTAVQITTLTPPAQITGFALAANQQTNAITDTQIRATPLPISGTVSTGLSQPLTDTQIRLTPLPISGTVSTGLAQPLTDTQIRATALPVSISSIPSHPVTNVGTFPVQATLPAEGVVSVVNSSVVNLGVGAVFTGTSEDLTIYSNIKVSVFSSHASATDGLSIQQSINGVDWDNSDLYTIPATTYRSFSVGVNSKFFRLIYTNGATLTTSLRIQVLYHKSDKQASSVRPQDARSNENDFIETLGFLMGYNGTSWDRLRSTVANGLAVDVSRLPTKATYRASTVIPLVVATTVNVPFFNIIGSATKIVTIKKITISGMTLTAVGYFAVNVEKLSTASTLGTSTTLVATALDSTSAAVTAVVKAYTAAPTKGALVGTIRCFRCLWQATTAAAGGVTDYYDFLFAENGSTGVVLRGVAQELALTFPVVLASAGTLTVCCEWTEE